MSDYSGNYDGQPHSISLTGLVPDDATVTYSTDGTTFGTDNPAFTNVGTYTVYYSISKDNYNTSNGSKTVTINKKPVTIKADEQNIIWGNIIDQSRYTTDGLATGDSIARLTLSPSTSALTDNGKISVNDVKIVNAAGEDVTGNYDITPVDGTLKITHDTSLAPERIEAKKTKDISLTVTIDGVTYKVTSVADNAFANNKKITKITIPSKVKKIGKQAFYGCKKLKTITIKTTKLTSSKVGSSAFKGIYAKATIKVPKSKLTGYKRILKAKGVSSKVKIKK